MLSSTQLTTPLLSARLRTVTGGPPKYTTYVCMCTCVYTNFCHVCDWVHIPIRGPLDVFTCTQAHVAFYSGLQSLLLLHLGGPFSPARMWRHSAILHPHTCHIIGPHAAIYLCGVGGCERPWLAWWLAVVQWFLRSPDYIFAHCNHSRDYSGWNGKFLQEF